MARSLLSVQLKKAILGLEKEYAHHIRCADEIQKKIRVLEQAHEITKPQNQRKGLDGRVIERKKRESKFNQSLDILLPSVLKQKQTKLCSTSEILQAVLELDGLDLSLKANPSYLRTLRLKLEKLESQQIVVRDVTSHKGNAVYWKLNA